MLSFFSSRRNRDSHQPLTRRRVCPPPGSGGGAHSLAGEGVEGSQFQGGDIHCGTLYEYICTLGFRLSDDKRRGGEHALHGPEGEAPPQDGGKGLPEEEDQHSEEVE